MVQIQIDTEAGIPGCGRPLNRTRVQQFYRMTFQMSLPPRRYNHPALVAASGLGFTEIVELLLTHGAHPDIMDFERSVGASCVDSEGRGGWDAFA